MGIKRLSAVNTAYPPPYPLRHEAKIFVLPFVREFSAPMRKGGVRFAYTPNIVFRFLHGCYHVLVYVPRHGDHQCRTEQSFFEGMVVRMGHRVSRIPSVFFLRAAADTEDYGKTSYMK